MKSIRFFDNIKPKLNNLKAKFVILSMCIFLCSFSGIPNPGTDLSNVLYYKGSIGKVSAQLNFEANEDAIEGSCLVIGQKGVYYLTGELDTDNMVYLDVYDENQEKIGRMIMTLYSTTEEFGFKLSGYLFYFSGKKVPVQFEKIAEVLA